MAKEPLYTMVAGGALEADTVFNVKCNCGGNAPITPNKVAGYGYAKKGGAMKVVDKLESVCEDCGTTINVLVIEGDPGYVLTSNGGVESLFLPQGSTSPPVSELSDKDRKEIINHMKTAMKIQQKKLDRKKRNKKRKQ